MNISLALATVVFVVGLAMYIWCKRESLREIGRIMFGVGLLVALLESHGGVALNLFKQ